MRLVIAGTSSIKSKFREWLARQWVAAAVATAPGARLLLVDSASPGALPSHPDLEVIQLGDDIGHLGSSGRDGWGRATMTALDRIAASDADWAAVWDADMLFVREVRPLITALETAGLPVGLCRANPYPHWIEGLFFFRCDWLRAASLPAVYDWQSVHPGSFPEDRIRAAIGPAGHILPLRGMRDDHDELTPENVWNIFPTGLDYLTHCQNPDVYRAVMAHYDIEEAA